MGSPGPHPADQPVPPVGERIQALVNSIGEVLKAYSGSSRGSALHYGSLHVFWARVMELMDQLEGDEKLRSGSDVELECDSDSYTEVDTDSESEYESRLAWKPMRRQMGRRGNTRTRNHTTSCGPRVKAHFPGPGRKVNAPKRHLQPQPHSQPQLSDRRSHSSRMSHQPHDRDDTETTEARLNLEQEVERLERDWWSSEVVAAWYGPQPFLKYQRQHQLAQMYQADLDNIEGIADLDINGDEGTSAVAGGADWVSPPNKSGSEGATGLGLHSPSRAGATGGKAVAAGRRISASGLAMGTGNERPARLSGGETTVSTASGSGIVRSGAAMAGTNARVRNASQTRGRGVKVGLATAEEEFSYDRAYNGSGWGGASAVAGTMNGQEKSGDSPPTSGSGLAYAGCGRRVGVGKVLIRRDASYVGLDDE